MITKKKGIVPIYDIVFNVFVADTTEEAAKECPLCEDKAMLGVTAYNNNARSITILIYPHTPNAVIAHECEHAKNMVWKFIGYTPNSEEDETDAYLIEYLFNQVEKTLGTHGKKKQVTVD